VAVAAEVTVLLGAAVGAVGCVLGGEAGVGAQAAEARETATRVRMAFIRPA